MILRVILFLSVTVGLTCIANADDSRPLYLSIGIEHDGNFAAEWKLPITLEPSLSPSILPPPTCSVDNTHRWSDFLGHWQSAKWNCPQGLVGGLVSINYPTVDPALATIVRLRLERQSELEQTLLLLPEEREIDIAFEQSVRTATTLSNYLQLGVEHIWRGIDHLLFVAGLIFIARTWRKILLTITGFTIAHSLTLALSALDLIRLQVRAVETVIALSIVFLAVEIAKGHRNSLAWRYPLVVSSSFGLLHGFGFAAVLREIGLPENNFLQALLGFNIGIELGQAAFAGFLMILFSGLRLLVNNVLQINPVAIHGQKIVAYTVGIISSYWVLERLFS